MSPRPTSIPEYGWGMEHSFDVAKSESINGLRPQLARRQLIARRGELGSSPVHVYDHWILGRSARQPRWSIARNVLHWMDWRHLTTA
jgi:hypothetical protein